VLIAVQKNAPHRAARPGHSLRKEPLLRITTKLHHCQRIKKLTAVPHKPL